MFGWWGWTPNNILSIQHALKLLMGCQAGASPSSFCPKLRRILAPGPDLLFEPTGEIDGHPEAATGDHGALGHAETPVRRPQQSHQGHVGVDQVRRGF